MKIDLAQALIMYETADRMQMGKEVYAIAKDVPLQFIGGTPVNIAFYESEVTKDDFASVVSNFFSKECVGQQELIRHIYAQWQQTLHDCLDEYENVQELLGGNEPPNSPKDVWAMVKFKQVHVGSNIGLPCAIMSGPSQWDPEHWTAARYEFGKRLVSLANQDSYFTEHKIDPVKGLVIHRGTLPTSTTFERE